MAVRNDFQQRTIRPFKVKEMLPEQKSVEIKKNGQVIKTINVRRKSRYFSGRNRLTLKKSQFVTNFVHPKNTLNKNIT